MTPSRFRKRIREVVGRIENITEKEIFCEIRPNDVVAIKRNEPEGTPLENLLETLSQDELKMLASAIDKQQPN